MSTFSRRRLHCVAIITGTNANPAIFEIQYDIGKTLKSLLASPTLKNDRTTNKTIEPVIKLIKLHSIAVAKNAIKQEIDKYRGTEPRYKIYRQNEELQYSHELSRKAFGETEINLEEIISRDGNASKIVNDTDKFEINLNTTHMNVKIDLQDIVKNLTWLRAQDLGFNYRHFKPLENKKKTNNKYKHVSANLTYVTKKIHKKITKQQKNTATVRLHYGMSKQRPIIFYKSQNVTNNIKNMKGKPNEKQYRISLRTIDKKEEKQEKTKARYEKGIVITETKGRKANEDKEIQDGSTLGGISQDAKLINQEQLKENKLYTNTESSIVLNLVTRDHLKKETMEAINLENDIKKETATQTSVIDWLESRAQVENKTATVAASLRGSNATSGVQNDIDKVLNSLLASSKLLEITESIANKVIEQVIKLRNKLISRKASNGEIDKKVNFREVSVNMEGRDKLAKKKTDYTEERDEEEKDQAIRETIDNSEKFSINQNETHRIMHKNLQDLMENLTELRGQDLSFNYRNFKGTDWKTQLLYQLTTAPAEMGDNFEEVTEKSENVAETEVQDFTVTYSFMTPSIFQNITENMANRKDTSKVNIQSMQYKFKNLKKSSEEVGKKVEGGDVEFHKSREQDEDNTKEGLTTTEPTYLRIVTYDDIAEERIKENIESGYELHI